MTIERKTTTIARGAASLCLLILILGGLPLVLVQEVGWPLPTAVPSLDQIGQAITTGAVEDATIIKALALLVWLAWLNFTTAVAVEGIAMARGRQARRRPGGHTAQQFAAQLLTSVSLAVSLLGRPAIATTAPDPASLRLAVATALADQPAPVSERTLAPVDQSQTPDARGGQLVREGQDGEDASYLVQRGDTLWDIAERFLGDGLRWRDLRDANIGRPQPGGVSLRVDSEEIQPGWMLTIPKSAGDEGSATAPDAAAEHVTVVPGDTLWDIADEQLGDPYRWPDVYEENEGRPQSDGRALNDPDLIQPGWILDIPDDGPADPGEAEMAEPPASVEGSATTMAMPPSEAEQPTTAPQPTPAETAAPLVRGRQTESMDGRRRAAEAPSAEVDITDGAERDPLVVATAAAALAAGVVLTLDRVRRTRLRRRLPGTRIPLPTDEAAAAEQRLRALADESVAEFVDLALRELAEQCAPSRVPPISLVSYNARELRVHLVGSHEAPPGWRDQEGGALWVRSRPMDVNDLIEGQGTPAPLPALMTIGEIEGSAPALLNLAHAGCLHVQGESRLVIDHLRAWALELATTPRADAIDVIAYGIPDLPSGLERLQLLRDGDDPRGLLSAPSVAEGPGPATVFLATDLDKDLLAWVRIATEQRSDLVAVVAAPPPRPGAWTLDVTADAARLDPLGATFSRLDLWEGTFERVGELLDQAKLEEDKPIPIPPAREDHVIEFDDEPEPARKPTVRILGTVDVDGPGPFVTNKTTELVVYLAMHRDGADADTLHEALWPDQRPRLARVHTEASRARKALGVGADGQLLLPPADMGMYRLSDEVVLDYDQFLARVAAAGNDVESAERHLRGALELVRGRPLVTGPVEYSWAVNDSYRITQEIVDAAHQLAQLLIAEDRYDEVGQVAEAGLRVDPMAEVLIRDLMEAAGATGNVARVEALMLRLRQQLAADGDANDADDYLHPDTLSLYESIRVGEDLGFAESTAVSPR